MLNIFLCCLNRNVREHHIFRLLIFISERESHPTKASPIDLILSPRVIEVRFEHPENAKEPILTRFLGKT